MKTQILSFTLFALFAIGCSSDPCDDLINLECLTGDADNDGIINSDDIAPLEPCLPEDNLACMTGDLDNDGIANAIDSDPLERCVPGVPTLELNIIGTWSWFNIGRTQFLEDGTYIDIENEILLFLNGDEIATRNWFVKNENILAINITNIAGQSVTADFAMTTNECDEINFIVVGNNFRLTR